MRIAHLAAGAGGMYCGSCLRDNRLAATLIEQGRDVVFVPLYTPVRTDEEVVTNAPVTFGGINVYLKHVGGLLGKLPRFVENWLDSPGVINTMTKWGGTSASHLGPLTLAVLGGDDGPLKREHQKLVDLLKQLKPDVINLPNLMFAGVAPLLREALDVPVLCTLSGEDIFLDDLPSPYRDRAFELIAAGARSIDGFVSLTEYYAEHAANHFALERRRIHVIPMGLRVSDFENSLASRPADRPGTIEDFTVGYMARICPEKGMHRLVEAMVTLWKDGRKARLEIAGYLGRGDRKFQRQVLGTLKRERVLDHVTFHGEVTREQKIAMLHRVDVLCVPTVYHEAKGYYVLEALAAGTPFVKPRHGSFIELHRATEGGLLYDTDARNGLVDALRYMMDNAEERRAMGERGRAVVVRDFTDQLMAERMWNLYEQYASGHYRRDASAAEAKD